MDDYIKRAVRVRPSERQLAWQEMEFCAFIHFGMNTFTDREWGLGNESPELFNPVEFNADQWVEACVCAGMKGLILTCKHHDGFCLWPSKYTEHSVKNSPWKEGKGDVVKDVSEACRRGGIKFGIYLSPWDRHEKTYGDSEKYNLFFMNQLRELLTSYGEIFCVWFDGACGEGLDGRRQVYDWEGYYRLIRELQPDAVISVCGPDVRWCGNEAGHCRESEWSVVPAELLDAEITREKSQKNDDRAFSKRINSEDEDLGSREKIKNAGELVWYPAEVNASIRPGWFYHASEDNMVKSVDELLTIYYRSVGGNAAFLLNIPPDKRGLIYENDVQRLKELGNAIKSTFSNDLAVDASVKLKIEVDLNSARSFNRVVLMEDIRFGQRVENFTLSYLSGDGWKEFFAGTVIGYKKICCFEKISARHIRIEIVRTRALPVISGVEVYKQTRRQSAFGNSDLS